MVAHADREHASWSASASARNFACPGALALTINAPESTSEAADWGTVCHELGEMCLRDGGDADRFIGTTRKGKKFSFEVDEEMAETAQQYVDYVRGVFKPEGAPNEALMWIEQRFDLSSLGTPFDAGGTGDAVIYLPAEKRLEVVDLKGGRGVVVEAKGNPQLRTYALGALVANKGLAVERVTVTIVQPRAPHPDGCVRSETLDVMDLVDWTFDMLEAMRQSKEAMDARADLAPAAWAAAYLTPGPHCGSTFCKAAATCPALEQAALDAVGVWFSPVDGTPQLANVPEQTDPDERAKRLDMLDMIENWVKQVRAHEHHLAEGGTPATGYGLVRKTGREKWKDGVEDQVTLACEMADIKTDLFLTPGKLRTPKQVRKALKDKAALVAELSETPTGGTNLVRLDNTMRQEIAAPITSFFTAQNKD